MKILDRYVRNHILSSTAIVVLVLMAVESLLEFISQLADIGTAHYTLYDAMLFVLMQLPADLYQLFPMAGFLGCLLGLGKLASTSQLTVMRAAGVSKNRISWTVIKAAILMMLVVTALGEFIAPSLQYKARLSKATATNEAAGVKALKNIWLRNEREFVHFAIVVNDHLVKSATLFDINQEHQLAKMAWSPTAYYSKGKWIMKNAVITRFSQQHLQRQEKAALPLNVILDLVQAQAGTKTAEQQSILGLLKTIGYRQHAGLLTLQYQFSLWQRIIQPFTAIVMICLGVPFIFGSLRTATMGSRLLMGVMVGFAFYLLNQFFGPFALLYKMPPMLAAITPTIIFMVGCVILLRRTV